jgi:hypothetical protein
MCAAFVTRASRMPSTRETTTEGVRKALVDAGIEIYRSEAEEILVAERIRLHLMDSGVRIRVGAGSRVTVTVRSQRSDFPTASSGELFSKVRAAMEDPIVARGFEEVREHVREITDPVDASRVLDVWYELTFEKAVPGVDALVDEVRWALAIPKCVTG